VSTDEEVDAPEVWFYPNHLGKLVLFGLVGGGPFLFFWAYRSWQAYAANAGYSRHGFWRRVRRATGYRPSPFWRALLATNYFLCLFPAVDRECRARGLRGVPAAEVLAAGVAVLWFVEGRIPGLLVSSLLSPVWLLVPVQLAINRLHLREGRPLHPRTDGWEVLWVALGLLARLPHLRG